MEPVIEIRQLTKSYGSNDVLKGIDLAVFPGEIIGYIGPNGAGKSTTVKILLGLVKGFSGSFSFFGEEISEGEFAYRKRIGYVPENAALYESLTASEYLHFIGRLHGLSSSLAAIRAEKLASLFGLEDAYHKRLSSYSKGMRQRVLWIAALLHNPEVLFLDEPLNGMDANTVQIVKELMHELSKRGVTIFYSSHIMDVVEKISDRIVLIGDGRILVDGTFEEIRKGQTDASLETIFGELTGYNRAEEIAEEIIQTMEGDDGVHTDTIH